MKAVADAADSAEAAQTFFTGLSDMQHKIKTCGIALLCLALVLGVFGCAWLGKQEEKTAAELAEEGNKHFQEEKYAKAIESYERLRDWYPYSPHAKTAELRIADSHYHLEEYEQALSAYQHYERLHPGDDKIPYVIYQSGMCHYDRLKSIDRTQVPARNALEAFNRLQSRFPGNEYAEKAEPKIRECRKRMAGHEFYVARFYYKSKHYKAALERFENVLEKYPEVEAYQQKAEDYVKQCREFLAEMDEKSKAEDPALRPTESRETGPQQAPVVPRQ